MEAAESLLRSSTLIGIGGTFGFASGNEDCDRFLGVGVAGFFSLSRVLGVVSLHGPTFAFAGSLLQGVSVPDCGHFF